MRKIFWSILVIALFLTSSVAFAENGQGVSGNTNAVKNENDEDATDTLGNNDDGAGIEIEETENEQNLVVSVHTDETDSSDISATSNTDFSDLMNYKRNLYQARAESIKGLKEKIKSEKEQIKERLRLEYQNLSDNAKDKIQAEHRMNLFVHSLLEIRRLGNLTGGIGQNVSEIAGKFNKSSEKVLGLQEKIQNRSKLAKFFTGNRKLAKEMNREIEQNRNMLGELNRIRETCGCNEETKTLLEEQIKEMEQEQVRLKEQADKESKKTGLFGWLL